LLSCDTIEAPNCCHATVLDAKYSSVKIYAVIFLVFEVVFSLASGLPACGQTTNLLRIQSVSANGRLISANDLMGKVRLGAYPKSVSFNFEPVTNISRLFARLRYKLDGYETNWNADDGQMRVSISFCDGTRRKIREDSFKVGGNSLGWNGTLENSTLIHRQETSVVPPGASRLWVTISSAGPPQSVGLYVVKDLVVTKSVSSGRVLDALLRSDDAIDESASNWIRDGSSPKAWIRDGTHPDMAKIVELGQYSKAKALAILDDDPAGHAEWHNNYDDAPQVNLGDRIMIEWNELYTMGVGDDFSSHNYEDLPPGKFRFVVSEVTALGVPTGVEASLDVVVSPPIWRQPIFLAISILLVILVAVGSSRYYTWRIMRHEMARIERQRELEQERLRIARDIHDDLGARATQISMLSSMSPNDQAFPDNARADLDRIFNLSKELIAALYQTIWTVSPEYDNLYALGNYICQMADRLCGSAQLRYRLQVENLPRHIQVSSQTRHNIIMMVKESVHNVVKHAKASEVTIKVAFDRNILRITIQDNGCGFEPATAHAGDGLTNMKRRLQDIGGTCVVESQLGHGTTVHMQLSIPLVQPDSRPHSGINKNHVERHEDELE
jgi:signal transduction histidine kinase